MDNVYYVYILEVIAKNGKKSFYTGYTNNFYHRISKHKKGFGAKFCRGRKDIKLKYLESFTNRKEAMGREREIKSYSKQKKLELIKSFNDS